MTKMMSSSESLPQMMFDGIGRDGGQVELALISVAMCGVPAETENQLLPSVPLRATS